MNKVILSLIGFVVLLLLLSTAMFTVTEGQKALVLRLGELQRTTGNTVDVFTPGLHFKIPFITRVLKFDVKLQTLNVDTSKILTAEQKYVTVDYYAKWRIENLPLYYKRTGGYPIRAQVLLKQQITDALRAAIAKRKIKEIISGERQNIMKILQAKANSSADTLGIKVTDVRIVAIDLPQEVRDSVFQRMRSEREQVATKHRSQGKAMAESIKANADAEVAVKIATAQTRSQIIRAKGDAEAAAIYTKTYNKNPKFYAFYKSLQSYRQVFQNKQTIMVLKPNSQFFRYFNKATSNGKP